MRTYSTSHLDEIQLLQLSSQCRIILRAWVGSSYSPQAVAFKYAAREEFGLEAYVHNPLRHGVSSEELIEAKRVARYLYELTQARFEADGVNRVNLYRGLKKRFFALGALQSWTANLLVAELFNGYDVLEKQIHSGRIIAFQGGPLWEIGLPHNELEYIVLSGAPND